MQAIVAEGVAREGLQEIVLTAEESAAKRLADFVSDTAIDKMIADAKETGVSLLDGPHGLIGQLTARIIERALGAEMDDHLGYEKGDPAGRGTGAEARLRRRRRSAPGRAPRAAGCQCCGRARPA